MNQAYDDRSMATRQLVILVEQEAIEIAERIRGLQRIAAFNRNLIGGEFDLTVDDKMKVAERCIDEVVLLSRSLLDAQVVAIRSARDAVDALRVMARADRLDEARGEDRGGRAAG